MSVTEEEAVKLFRSPEILAHWARSRWVGLKSMVDKWTEENPYSRIHEFDAESGEDIVKLRLTQDLPIQVSLLTFDVVCQLRAALDHAVYASAVAFGAVNIKETHFPFADTAKRLDDTLDKGRSKDAPAGIKPFLRSFNSYKGGNETLWSLNKMRNARNHRSLVVASIHTDKCFIEPRMSPGQREWKFPGMMKFSVGPWDPEKQEIEILRVTQGMEANYELKYSAFVAVGDIEAMRGKPLVATLHEIGVVVEGVLKGIEAETIRLLREQRG